MGIDDLGMAIYFAKPVRGQRSLPKQSVAAAHPTNITVSSPTKEPHFSHIIWSCYGLQFTTVRVPRKGGGFTIARKPVEDPELENDEIVRARLLEEGMAAPQDQRLLRTGSMLPGAQPHFHGASILAAGSGSAAAAADRVARVQLSTTALEPFLGPQATSVVSQAAQQVKLRVIKAGGGRIMGSDSGALQQMEAAGVDTAKLGPPAEAAAEEASEAAAASPDSGDVISQGTAPPAAWRHGPGLHHPQQSIMSMPAQRRPGGGIVTVDAPTAVLVAEMRAAKKLMTTSEQQGAGDVTTSSDVSNAGGDIPTPHEEASASGTPPAASLRSVLQEAQQKEATTTPGMQKRAAELATKTVTKAAAGGDSEVPAAKIPEAEPLLSQSSAADSLPKPVVLTQQDMRSKGPSEPLRAPTAAITQPVPLNAATPSTVVGRGAAESSTAAPRLPVTTTSEEEGSTVSRQISPRFGELVRCSRNCTVCKKNGRLRYIGHRREAIIVAPEPSVSRFPQSSLASSAFDSARGAYLTGGGGGNGDISAAEGAGAVAPTHRHVSGRRLAIGSAAAGGGANATDADVTASPLQAVSRHAATSSTIPGLLETFGEPRMQMPEQHMMTSGADVTEGAPSVVVPHRLSASGGTGAGLELVSPPGAASGTGTSTSGGGRRVMSIAGLDGGTGASGGGSGGSETDASLGLHSPGGGTAAPTAPIAGGVPISASPAAQSSGSDRALGAALARTTMAINEDAAAAPSPSHITVPPLSGADHSVLEAEAGGQHFTHPTPLEGGGFTYSTQGPWATAIPRVASRSRSRGLFSRSSSRAGSTASREQSGPEARLSLASAAAAGGWPVTMVEALAHVPETTREEDMTSSAALGGNSGARLPVSSTSSSEQDPEGLRLLPPSAAAGGATFEPRDHLAIPLGEAYEAPSMRVAGGSALADTAAAVTAGSNVHRERLPWYKRFYRKRQRVEGEAGAVPQVTGAEGSNAAAAAPAPTSDTVNVTAISGAGQYPQPFAVSYATQFEALLHAPALPVAQGTMQSEQQHQPPATSAAAAAGYTGTQLPAGVHAVTKRNFERRFERGNYITIGELFHGRLSTACCLQL